MIIRQLTEEDLVTATTLDQVANLSAWSLNNYQQSYHEATHYLLGLFNEQKDLLGTCVYSILLDEAEILQLVIHQDYQTQGLGKQLLQYVCHELSLCHVRQIFLEVRLGNTAATNLYHKLGFNITGQRKNYYQIDGQSFDALLMCKFLG